MEKSYIEQLEDILKRIKDFSDEEIDTFVSNIVKVLKEEDLICKTK
jgi:hypothetical protein